MKVTKITPEPVGDTYTIEGLTQEQMDYLTSCAYHCGTPGTRLSMNIHTELVDAGGNKTLVPEVRQSNPDIWLLVAGE